MEDGTGSSVWAETTGIRAPVTVEQSTPVSLSSRVADFADITPVSRAEFAAEMVPCLALVAPTGMDASGRKEWLNAAYRALDGIPVALLQRGCAAALTKADHPAKIVPAILKEIGEVWERRKRLAAPRQQDAAPALPAPDQCTPDEAREIIERFGLGRRSHAAPSPSRPAQASGPSGLPSRKPTRADYIRLFGIDPGESDAPESEAA